MTGGGYAPEWEEYPAHPRCFRSSGQENIKKFARWLSLLSAGIITGTVAGSLAQREGASCRRYANKLNCHAIGGQTRPRGLRNIKNSPGRFSAWSIHIVTMESEEDRRLYNSQALVPDGMLQPMELAHLSYKNGKTYEDYLGERGLERLGKRKWRLHVATIAKKFKAALEADTSSWALETARN